MNINDFTPGNWYNPFKLEGGNITNHIADRSSKKIWDKEAKNDKLNVGLKCLKHSFYTPFTHTVKGVIAIVMNTFRILSFYHFRGGTLDKTSFKAAVSETFNDALAILAQPAAIITLEVASIYGWFQPYDGRKIYASIERLHYRDEFLHTDAMQPIKTNLDLSKVKL